MASSGDVMENEVRVVLLGKSGSGKSCLGNTLLGREAFTPAHGLSSGTERCQWAEGLVDGNLLCVTDTPGLCDTHRKEEDILKEIGKSVAVACPGPHAVIIVISCDRRFTQEEYMAVKTLQEFFGGAVRKHLMIVFTGGDCLKVPIEDMQNALKLQVERASEDLREVLSDAYDRHCVVDNTGTYGKRKAHGRVVLKLIKDVMRRNQGKFFTNQMVDKYQETVLLAIQRRQNDRHLSREDAVRDTRQAIVDENLPEEPGFLQNLIKIATDSLRRAVGNAVHHAVALCSIM